MNEQHCQDCPCLETIEYDDPEEVNDYLCHLLPIPTEVREPERHYCYLGLQIMSWKRKEE